MEKVTSNVFLASWLAWMALNSSSQVMGTMPLKHRHGATSIRWTFKSSKNEKLFNSSKEFHISDFSFGYILWRLAYLLYGSVASLPSPSSTKIIRVRRIDCSTNWTVPHRHILFRHLYPSARLQFITWLELLCIKMAAKLITPQLLLKLELMHNETCRS